VLLSEGLGLLLQEGGERALGQTASGLQSDRFQGGEIDSQAWSFGAESPPGDNFAPLGRQVTDFLEVLGC
jgi:hypothetical protein